MCRRTGSPAASPARGRFPPHSHRSWSRRSSSIRPRNASTKPRSRRRAWPTGCSAGSTSSGCRAPVSSWRRRPSTASGSRVAGVTTARSPPRRSSRGCGGSSKAGSPRPAGITLLRLVPDEVVPATGRQLGFWGGDPAAGDHAARALARVQGMLGPESVVTAVPVGGRTPTERVRWVPWGEDPIFRPEPARSRPRRGRGRSPGRHRRASSIRRTPPISLDADGQAITVSGRGEPSAAPAALRCSALPNGGGPLVAWAGHGRTTCVGGTGAGGTGSVPEREAGSVPERETGAGGRCGRWSSTVAGTRRSRAWSPSPAAVPRSKPSTTETTCQTAVDADPRRRARALRHVVGHGDARHHAGAAFLLEPDNPGQYPFAAARVVGMGVVAGARTRRTGTPAPAPPLGHRVRSSDPVRTAASSGSPSGCTRKSDARRTVAHDAHRGSEDEPAVARGRGTGGAAQPPARHPPPRREVDPSALHGRVDRRELAPHGGRVPSASARCRREPDGDGGPDAGRRWSHRSSATRRGAATASRSRRPTTTVAVLAWRVACRCRCCDDAARREPAVPRRRSRGAVRRSGRTLPRARRPRSASTGRAENEAVLVASNRPGTGYELNRVQADLPGAWRRRLSPEDARTAAGGDRAAADRRALRPRSVEEPR